MHTHTHTYSGICSPSISYLATTRGRQKASWERGTFLPLFICLFMDISLELTLRAPTLSPSWCRTQAEWRQRMETACSISCGQFGSKPASRFTLWAISPWLMWPPFWFIDWSGTVDIDGTWEVPLVLLFPLPFGWANYLFQPCLSAESAGSFW